MPNFASGMQKGTGNTIYHVLAIVIVAIWGLTFISTKVLLMAGLSPEEIFLVRFSIAYFGMWLFCLWGSGSDASGAGGSLATRGDVPADGSCAGISRATHIEASGDASRTEPSMHARVEAPADVSCTGVSLTGSQSVQSPARLFCNSLKDELLLVLAGVMGGSLYFWSENTALQYTMASNVSFIVCTTPLVTAILNAAVRRERIGRLTLLGGCLSLVGIAMIAFSGGEGFHLSFLGDALAMLASLTWAIYTVVTNGLLKKYPSALISRKVFFYGMLTIVPVLLVKGWTFPAGRFLEPKVLLNALFLGVVASLACYALWNSVIKRLGTVGSSNYIYLNPLFTLIAATLLLGERLTPVAIAGCLITLIGVWTASRSS